MSEPIDGAAYNLEHQLEPTEEFDYSKIDADLGWAERGSPEVAIREEAVQMATDGFCVFLAWVWLTPTGKARNPESAKLRFLAATATLRPDFFQNKSFNQLAQDIGLTRAAISKISVEFADFFKVHFRCQRRSEARERYSEAALRSHK